MKGSRFLLALMMALSLVGLSTMGVSAQGVGGGGAGGSTGGSGGSTGGGIGSGSTGGATLGWGPCPAGYNMVAWNTLQFGTSPSGSQLTPYVYDAANNPKGNVYIYPNTPFGGQIPGAWNGYKDQNGNKYDPWWACYQTSQITYATPPKFAGFNAFAPASIQTGSIHLIAPTSCAPNCTQFIVFDKVTLQTNDCTLVAGLTPMVPPPATFPSTNTGQAYTNPQPGCPESVTVAGIDTTGTYKFQYTLQWQPDSTGPCANAAKFKWNWGVPASHADECQGGTASFMYTHVADLPGVQISATKTWTPKCTGMVLNQLSGAYVVNDPTPGSYPCTGAGSETQTYVDPKHYPVYQIESISAG